MNENRDKSVLIHICMYCDQAVETMDIFGRDYDEFLNNSTYRNACCMCLLQIGELTNHLSDGFREKYAGVPWKQIRGFRNIVAHAYGTIEPEIVWEILMKDLQELSAYCRLCLEQENDICDNKSSR